MKIMEPDTGFLAEGYEGKGRMPEPDKIVEAAQLVVLNNAKELPLKGKKCSSRQEVQKSA